MKQTPLLIVLASGLFILGCAPAPPARPSFMENPPANQPNSLPSQVAGDWAVMKPQMDADMARQLGLEVLNSPPAEEDIDEVYHFKPDGTFSFGKWDAEWKVEGNWQHDGQYLNLSYLTYNGRPLDQVGEEMKKKAEGGTQAGVAGELLYDQLMATISGRANIGVASDAKMLQFIRAGQDGSPVPGESLVRLKPTATK